MKSSDSDISQNNNKTNLASRTTDQPWWPSSQQMQSRTVEIKYRIWSACDTLQNVGVRWWWWHTDCSKKETSHSNMLLDMATRSGTFHVTFENHAMQYLKYMHNHVNYIKKIFLNIVWSPNHHAALHVHKFLLKYGPMYSWWMLSFKQIIRKLQKTKNKPQNGWVVKDSKVQKNSPIKRWTVRNHAIEFLCVCKSESYPPTSRDCDDHTVHMWYSAKMWGNARWYVPHQLMSVHVMGGPGREASKTEPQWCDSDDIGNAWQLRSSMHRYRAETYKMSH